MTRTEILKPVEIDHREYLAPSWEEMGRVCFSLARRIQENGGKYDRLVALAKGGLTWSRTMVDLLNIPDIGSIQTKHYQDIDQKFGKPRIVQSFPQEVYIKDEQILLFDDVNDTGESLRLARDYLDSWAVKSVDIAVLFSKPSSALSPDFFGVETSAWIIFPHEVREAVSRLRRYWLVKGVPDEEIIRRLQVIGLKTEQIEFFWSLEKSLL